MPILEHLLRIAQKGSLYFVRLLAPTVQYSTPSDDGAFKIPYLSETNNLLQKINKASLNCTNVTFKFDVFLKATQALNVDNGVGPW